MSKKQVFSDREIRELTSYSDNMIDGLERGDTEYMAYFEGRIIGFLDCLYLQKKLDRVTRDGIFSYYARDRVYGYKTGGKEDA